MSETREAVGPTQTPGPWEYQFEATRYVIQHRPEGSPGKRAIAITAGGYAENGANARLIASAPTLLAALEAAERAIIGMGVEFARFTDSADERWEEFLTEDAGEVLELVREAIRQGRGE
jgi:hypothetical protein